MQVQVVNAAVNSHGAGSILKNKEISIGIHQCDRALQSEIARREEIFRRQSRKLRRVRDETGSRSIRGLGHWAGCQGGYISQGQQGQQREEGSNVISHSGERAVFRDWLVIRAAANIQLF